MVRSPLRPVGHRVHRFGKGRLARPADWPIAEINVVAKFRRRLNDAQRVNAVTGNIGRLLDGTLGLVLGAEIDEHGATAGSISGFDIVKDVSNKPGLY